MLRKTKRQGWDAPFLLPSMNDPANQRWKVCKHTAGEQDSRKLVQLGEGNYPLVGAHINTNDEKKRVKRNLLRTSLRHKHANEEFNYGIEIF
jgi:hypothetical protein